VLHPKPLPEHPGPSLTFLSDNAGEVLAPYREAIAYALEKHHAPYGMDSYTEAAKLKANAEFGDVAKNIKAHLFMMDSGSGANNVAMSALLDRSDKAFMSAINHSIDQEGNAFGISTGTTPGILDSRNGKIYIPEKDGKLDTDYIKEQIFAYSKRRHVQPTTAAASTPKVLCITQPTEIGTLYSKAEIKALADFAHANNMVLYMDGARLWNAAAALGCKSLKEMTTDLGVDVFSLNGTKNGMAFMDALVFLERPDTPMKQYFSDPQFLFKVSQRRRQLLNRPAKEAMQAAQFLVAFDHNYALKAADRSNKAAGLIEQALRQRHAPMPFASKTSQRRSLEQATNAVLLVLPEHKLSALEQHYKLYTFPTRGIHGKPETVFLTRIMPSPDDTEADIKTFLDVYDRVMSGK